MNERRRGWRGSFTTKTEDHAKRRKKKEGSPEWAEQTRGVRLPTRLLPEEELRRPGRGSQEIHTKKRQS